MNAMSPGRPRPPRAKAADDQPAGGVRLTMDFDDDDVPLDQLPDGAPDQPGFGPSPADPADADPPRPSRRATTQPAATDPAATEPASAAAAATPLSDQPAADSPGAPPATGDGWSHAPDPAPGPTAPRTARAPAAGAAVSPRLSAITVTLSVELGRQKVPLGELMASTPGHFFTLDRLTSEPVDILVNGQPFARGDVVVLGDQFGVRLSELLDPEP